MDSRIRILLRIIEERRGTLQMTSKQVGSLLGLGEARILRLFNAEVGMPLRRYLLVVRMSWAAEWLKAGVLPIKTIASDCGYTEVSNFYRDFKSVHGTSPMQMRLTQMSHKLRGGKWHIASLEGPHASSPHLVTATGTSPYEGLTSDLHP